MNQTVQQAAEQAKSAAEQAKSAGQKGMVMFMSISKCQDSKIPNRAPNPALLLVPRLVGKGELLQLMLQLPLFFLFSKHLMKSTKLLKLAKKL